MSEIARLDNFSLRAVGEEDRKLLDDWIEKDLGHKSKLEANYFLGLYPDGTPDSRPTCYAIEDENGSPLLYIRLSKVARVRIQFPPLRNRRQRMLNAEALMKGMAYLEALLAQCNTEEWIFDTTNMELAHFAISHLGFQASPNEMKRGIEPPKGQNEQDGALAASGSGV
jgi:hypothetical protein